MIGQPMIFVLDRGFVVVGVALVSGDLIHHWHMSRSVTVRRWGTTKGLAQLRHGPAAETVLDEPCERMTPFRSVIDMICCTSEGAEKWLKVLSGA